MNVIAKAVMTVGEPLFERLSKLGVKNLRRVGQSCVSGATLERSATDLMQVKNAGIRTIVDFRSEASKAFAQECKNIGLDYKLFPLEHTRAGMAGTVIRNGESTMSDAFAKQLKEFINTVNEGHVYMGCNYGIDRTNLGLVLNYLLNPKAVNPPKILTWGDFRTKSVINKTLKVARKMIKKMTPEQKELFNLPENYNEIFQDKIAKLLALNLYR